MRRKRRQHQISDLERGAISVLIARQVMAKARNKVSEEMDASLALAILMTKLCETHGMSAAFENVAEIRRGVAKSQSKHGLKLTDQNSKQY